MIDRVAFSRGLTRIATVIRRAVDDATLEFYFEVLEQATTAEEWEAFTRAAAAAHLFDEIPALDVLERELALWRERTGRLRNGRRALPPARKPETPAEVEAWRVGIQAGLDRIRSEMAARGMPLDQVVGVMPAAPATRRKKARA